jgi:hypothetical protein
MAIYNEILVGRYARMLQKLFGIKGTVPTKQLAGEVAPAFPLFNGVENRYLESWDRFGASAAQTASVGNNSGFRLRNPVGSNVIAVIEQLRFEVDTANSPISIETGPAVAAGDGATVYTPRGLDPRGRTLTTMIVTSGNGLLTLGGGNIAAIGFGEGQAGVHLDLIQDENQEIPILPGQALNILTAGTNLLLRVSCLWRERFLEESERT